MGFFFVADFGVGVVFGTGVAVIFGFIVGAAADVVAGVGVPATGVPTFSSVWTFPPGGVSTVPGRAGGGFGLKRTPSEPVGGMVPPRFVFKPLSAGRSGAGEC